MYLLNYILSYGKFCFIFSFAYFVQIISTGFEIKESVQLAIVAGVVTILSKIIDLKVKKRQKNESN